MARRRPLTLCAAAVGVVAVFALAWVVTDLEPFSATTAIAVTAVGVATIAYGRSRPSKSRRGNPVSPAGIAGWVALFAAVAAWQLAAYFQEPRTEHPTLSSLTNSVLDAHLMRTAAFVAWVALGVRFARR